MLKTKTKITVNRSEYIKPLIVISSMILVLLAEIFSFELFVRNGSIISGGLNFSVNNSIWISKSVFVYSFNWIYFVVASIVLVLLLREKIGKLELRFEFRYLIYHLVFFLLFLAINLLIFFRTVHVNYFILLPLWYLLILCFSLSLIFFIFGSTKVFAFFRLHKTDVIGSLLLSYLFIGTYFLLSSIWQYLSSFIGRILYFLLSIFYSDVYYSSISNVGGVLQNAPTIGVGTFHALIIRECAGIEGLALFIFLFAVIVLVDHKKLNWLRTSLAFLIGLIGMVVLNIIRIFVLILFGIEYSGSFAVGVAHSNLGWLLFGLYFAIFLYISYNWMMKEEFRKKNRIING